MAQKFNLSNPISLSHVHLKNPEKMAVDTSPTFVYKILPEAPPELIPAVFPLSDLDKNDGFIHLSTGEQVPGTANLFFHEQTSIWIVKFEFSKFASSIKFEGGFPHLYGNFGRDDIHGVEKFTREGGASWLDTLKASTWLE